MKPEEIRAELDARGMSIRDLAEATGIHENFLTKSLGRAGRRIQLHEMEAIERVLAPDTDDARLPTIPHLGAVPAGAFRGAEHRGGRRFAVSDPSTPPNAYALTVDGDSMDLIAPGGTTIIIDPDDTALWPGKRYVVQTEDGQTTFKEFQEAPARLVPCSSNPAHREIPLGSEPVKVLGRVHSYTFRDADLVRRGG
jgi:SOS-response transcriptional repressor LexA